ncbi:MAG: glycoside hydrolase family 30 protein [Prevotella sp.]|nr:glycoside hydrolase family 30 protein [Prevotella sp.]
MKRLLLMLTAAAYSLVQAQTYTIHTDQPRQTIEHFGASDAWSMQNIGLWEEADVQRQIADWLFSTENDADGQPRGIGLTVWRFNLGAGSAYQGDSSYINKGTRTECFLMPDGSYDWDKQPGQVRFLKMAKERGVNRLLAFLNSPPVYFTKNGLATNTGRDGTLNLRDDCYDDFASYMAEAVAGLEYEHRLHIDYICPVNEPDGHWNWQGPKQEGSPATNREIARLVRETSNAFTKRGLSTQIMVNESSDLRCLLGVYKTTWERGNAIDAFFCKDSTETYLGDLPNVPRLILAHSYWTNTPVRYMKRIRQQLHDKLKERDAEYWQTELCIMSNDEEIGGGGGYDFTMKTGLYVARVIHHDLVYGHAKSWSWWRACGGNYKDGLIRVFDRRHTAKDSRLLWCLGNYSRFVRPDAVRYEVSSPKKENPYGVMVSAYRNEDRSWVVVAINYSNKEQPFNVCLGSPEAKVSWQPYRTSDNEGETLKPLAPVDGPTTLAPRSITTFVSK